MSEVPIIVRFSGELYQGPKRRHLRLVANADAPEATTTSAEGGVEGAEVRPNSGLRNPSTSRGREKPEDS